MAGWLRLISGRPSLPFGGEIRERGSGVAGFNVGVDLGPVGGQTIPHCHLHLIPRRLGDVPNPRGGVRHVIPGKGDYARE